jgi:HPt (histidine-containing phosphotransfer) domain-containing protein
MGGLQSVYIMALRSFVEEADKLAAELQTAHAVLDTAAALPALHTLKGLAGTIGADRLADLARDAEHALRPGGAAGAWQLVALALAACPAAVDDVESLLVQLAAGATA